MGNRSSISRILYRIEDDVFAWSTCWQTSRKKMLADLRHMQDAF